MINEYSIDIKVLRTIFQLLIHINNQPILNRIANALSLMTLEEKVAFCHAQSKFSYHGVSRLGIPELWMSDGFHGVRMEILWDSWSHVG